MKPEGILNSELGIMNRKADGKDTKKDGLKLAVAVVNTGIGLEKWQEMNTVAHLNAAFGARKGMNSGMFYQDQIITNDKVSLPLNIQHAIMIKQADASAKLLDLVGKAKEAGLDVSVFTREMLITTNDKKVVEMTAEKSAADLEMLGVLVYGDKAQVEELTKEFGLFS